MKAGAENYIIQTVSRALDLLEQFQEGTAELGITDLSNRLNLQKNNVFRLVATLKAKNYIEINNSTGKYRLGVKTRALGQVATRLIDFSNQARPFLIELKQMCHEACYFSVIKDGYTYYLAGVESDLPVRVTLRVGSSRPLHCTAAGKLLLAARSWPEVQRMLGRNSLERFTPRTILSPEVLRRELEAVRTDGVALDREECEEGATCIAAPVRNARGETVAAMSISGPTLRMHPERIRELTPVVVGMGREASERLGHGVRSAKVSQDPPRRVERKRR